MVLGDGFATIIVAATQIKDYKSTLPTYGLSEDFVRIIVAATSGVDRGGA